LSRAGCCCDNAVAERYGWSLKREWTNHLHFANLDDACLRVFRSSETLYNSQQLHQSLGYLSPNQFEAVHAPAHAA
jgi:putative transposase